MAINRIFVLAASGRCDSSTKRPMERIRIARNHPTTSRGWRLFFRLAKRGVVLVRLAKRTRLPVCEFSFHSFYLPRPCRRGIGQAGVNAEPFEAWIDEWSLRGENFDELTLKATGSNFSYRMSLEAKGPIVFHGDKGYSLKSSEGQASYYYSQPFF